MTVFSYRGPFPQMRATDFDFDAASDTATVRSDEPTLPGVVIFVIGSCLSGADLAQLDRTTWWIFG